MIWLTSDYHFSHPNITGPSISRWKSGFRDFDTVHQMNKTLTDTTNKYVKKGDILYFLGDWCFGGHEKTPMYRDLLNVETIHFLRGNHDKRINDYKDSFTSLNNTLDIELQGKKVHLSHYAYPNNIWPGKDEGGIHLYGHSHGSREDFEKSMDIGVDVAYRLFGEYRPFSEDEIIEIMNTK